LAVIIKRQLNATILRKTENNFKTIKPKPPMAKTNDIIENPVIGDKLQFLVTAEDSKGELLKVKLWNKIGAQGPPEHIHPKQIEIFEVISGTAGIKLHGTEHILTAGQTVTVPMNAPHTFRNAGENELIMTAELKPALQTEYFLETMYSLAKKGKVNKDSVPNNFLHFMTILNEYYGESFIVGPPVPAQKILAKIAGGLGKFLGYKGFVQYDRN
jgi:mannose-6-phosphate isomerase-like protein (cupin superfamily)